ncbi:MAG: calcium-binding protein, partial [Microcoleaceae cyanobacterium]
VMGGTGNDKLWGDEDNDTLTGIDPTASTPGITEIDTLTGGTGANLFILGDQNQAYYNDGNSATPGTSDYALIMDFNPEVDVIALWGTPSKYTLSPTAVDGASGTGIYLDSNANQRYDNSDELIALVRNVTVESTNASYLKYVI